MQLVVANMSSKATPFTDIDFCKPTALIMGAEKKGASDAALDEADYEVCIPMLGMVESYNVSVAAGIILNEALRQRTHSSNFIAAQLPRKLYEHYLFKWGYARLAEFCEERSIAFPSVNDAGDIVDPNGEWRALIDEASKAASTNESL
jgi:tRNA (guanosine-2'-O-)-methyltransferase